jgi:hypothetical protein
LKKRLKKVAKAPLEELVHTFLAFKNVISYMTSTGRNTGKHFIATICFPVFNALLAFLNKKKICCLSLHQRYFFQNIIF